MPKHLVVWMVINGLLGGTQDFKDTAGEDLQKMIRFLETGERGLLLYGGRKRSAIMSHTCRKVECRNYRQ